MTTLTLLTKISNDNQLKQIDKGIELQLNGLEVETEIIGTVADGWVQMSILGEDERIASNYVIKEIGVCPINLKNVKKLSTLKGYLTNIGKSRTELTVDLGIFEPKVVHAKIPLRHLQTELVYGRKIAMRKIVELFGLCDGLPLSVKVSGLDEEESRIDAELSSRQIRKYEVWRDSLLDRLLILGSPLYEINATIEHENLDRDVLEVEPLGMFEHALTCKLGTDATGLIPKIGRKLKKASFNVFNPKTLRQFLST
ncbi:DUF2110 family protein [Candidatus Bathyarchaeota archaeon]|nr:DUF2110 family protein [Candidatus Bathyarchaeota archaeon]